MLRTVPADDKPVLICDLDGTILHINSFPLWVLYLIGGRLPELGFCERVRMSLRVQKLLLHRKLGRIDHRQLMRGVQLAWRDADRLAAGAPATRLQGLLRRQVRPAFRPLLQQIAAGERDAILATAAAGEYANALGCHLGFRHVLATPSQLAPGEPLNAGRQKLSRVIACLSDQQWDDRPLVLLTDHLDDLPLMRHCNAVGWFGSAATMARASALTGGTKLVSCGGVDSAGLVHVLDELCAHAALAPKPVVDVC